MIILFEDGAVCEVRKEILRLKPTEIMSNILERNKK